MSDAELERLKAECEMRRDEADSARLKWREMELWLLKIKETLRPWWTDPRSNWDGSLCGLPNVVEAVAGKFRDRDYAINLSLIALGAAHHLVGESEDTLMLEMVEDAISACHNATRDQDDDESDFDDADTDEILRRHKEDAYREMQEGTP